MTFDFEILRFNCTCISKLSGVIQGRPYPPAIFQDFVSDLNKKE